MEIAEKRNQIKSPKKETESVYSKNILWKKKIIDRSMELKKKKDDSELKECSFSPMTSFSGRAKLNEEFYEKNIKWKKDIQKQNQSERVYI